MPSKSNHHLEEMICSVTKSGRSLPKNSQFSPFKLRDRIFNIANPSVGPPSPKGRGFEKSHESLVFYVTCNGRSNDSISVLHGQSEVLWFVSFEVAKAKTIRVV